VKTTLRRGCRKNTRLQQPGIFLIITAVNQPQREITCEWTLNRRRIYDDRRDNRYCGYNCHLCAARSDDAAIRQRLVDGWRRIFGHQNYTAENVRCDGCLSDGRLADKQCQARPCAIERGVKNCAYCEDFVCEKVRQLLGSREEMLIFHHKRAGLVTEEEYNLCMRQFDSTSNVVRMLVDAGKLAGWVEESSKGQG